MKKTIINRGMAVVLAGAAFVGSTFAAQAATKLPPVNPAEVKGNIVIAGSSTVYPLAMKLAEDFKKDGYADNLTIDSIGSGAGIARFCRGEIDIANASRAMNEKELAACKAIGREPIQFQIGIDALTIVMSRQNKFVNSLNRKQLALIYSGKAKTWKDVNANWPAEKIKLFSPGTDSGTYDYFTEEIFKEESSKDARHGIPVAVPGIQLSEDDNVLVKGVEGSPNAIGYFGFAYYNEEKARLKAIGYEGVIPSEATVNNKSYKFARPLFMITTAKIMKEKPQVAAFLNYSFTNVQKVIKGVGYFAEPEAKLDETRAAFVDAVK